ncbi:MAG: hypothetical protein IJT64_05650 [Kiritimatiellae bacterium]|nr:hypothetical protein [Kiritimatiellia bacterium]
MIRGFLQRLRAQSGGIWWYTLLGFVAARMGEIVNFYIGVILVPKHLPASDLGAIQPLLTVGGFFAFPIAILLIPVGKFLSVFAARGETGKVKALLSDALCLNALFAVVVAIWLYVSGDALLLRLHVTDRRILIPVAAFAVLSCAEPIISTAQKALKCFRSMIVSGMVAPYVRLAAMLLLLAPFGVFGYLSAQLATTLFGVGCAGVALVLVLRKCGGRTSYRADIRDMVVYSLPLLALTLAGRVTGPAEAFIMRHRLPEEVTAGYYFSTMFGAIPGYATSALLAFFWPIVSEKFEKGESTRRLLAQSLAFNLVIGVAALVATALVVPYVFRMPGPWAGYREYARYVAPAGLITLLANIQGTYTAHESACRRFVYVWYCVPISLIEAALLYGLPAIGPATPYVPDFVTSFVTAHWHNTLPMFLGLIIAFKALGVVAMAIDWWFAYHRAERN